MALLAGGPGRPSALLAWTLVALALAQTPIGLVFLTRRGVVASRQAALSRAIFSGVTLSTSAWFAALAVATGQGGVPLALLVVVLTSSYALGFLAVGRLARTAAALPPRSSQESRQA